MIELFLSSGASPHALTSDGDTAIAATTVLVWAQCTYVVVLVASYARIVGEGARTRQVPGAVHTLSALDVEITTDTVCVCVYQVRTSKPPTLLYT